MTARPTEIRALAKLLVDEGEWESPEAMAKVLIETLDQERASRLSYVGIMQFGAPGRHLTVGIGPYVSQGAAKKAVEGHPAASEAVVRVVTSLQSEEGVKNALRALDAEVVKREPTSKERQRLDKAFWGEKRKIDEKEKTAITHVDSIKVLKVPK